MINKASGRQLELTPDIANCKDCELPYQEFGIDTTLPDDQWLMIHPEGFGGLLCANCIVNRASRLSGIIAARMRLEIVEGGQLELPPVKERPSEDNG